MGGSPASVTKIGEIILDLAELYDLHTFVETGTYQSETAKWACQHFNHVYTVELDVVLYAHAKIHEQNYPRGQLNVYSGLSTVFLDEILQWVKDPIFWLDAHGMTTADTGSSALEELRVIERMMAKPKVILIDDAMLFEMRVPGWPAVQQVADQLTQMGLTFYKEKDVYVAYRVED